MTTEIYRSFRKSLYNELIVDGLDEACGFHGIGTWRGGFEILWTAFEPSSTEHDDIDPDENESDDFMPQIHRAIVAYHD